METNESDKRPRPVAICPDCGAVYYSPLRINQRCGRLVDGKPCKGSISSALMKNDWEECSSCLGSGEKGEATCSKCKHVGWLFRAPGKSMSRGKPK
jgi:hypothetical protein